MRIGVLANTVEEDSALAVGGHVHFLEIARRLDADDLVVFAPPFIEERMRALLPKAQFVGLPSCEHVTKIRAVVFLFRSIAALRYARMLRRCDILWATSHFLPDVMPAVVVRRNASVVCIHHLIGGWRGRSGNRVSNFVAYFAERAALLLARVRARAIIAGSAYVERQLRAMGFAQPMGTTTNGADRLKGPDEVPVQCRSGAVYVGRLHPTKGLDDLLRAWRLTLRSHPEEGLILIGTGDPSYVKTLQTLSEELGIRDRVSFLGYVEDDEKKRRLQTARVFVFPSKEEGWGIALAEALNAGVPCVTYDLPVFRGLFDRGRLYAPVGDWEEFARQTNVLLTDDRRWEEVSRDGFASSFEFNWDRAAQAERALMESVHARNSI